LRNVLLDCLELLEVNRTTLDDDLLTCLKFILEHRRDKLADIPVKSIGAAHKGKDKTVVDWI